MKTRQQPHRKECMLLKKIANNAMSVSFSHRYVVIVVFISCLIHGLVTWAGDISAPGEVRVTLSACAVRVSSPCVCTLEHVHTITDLLSHTQTHTFRRTHKQQNVNLQWKRVWWEEGNSHVI